MPVFDPSPIEVYFWDALALMAAACVFVPLFRKLGLGTILGYLVAGLVIRAALSDGMSEHPEELLHFAEFGVVLFLFVIGLELRPRLLWQMRSDIFGLGLAQVLLCAAVIAPAALAFGFSLNAAIIVGLGFALSSTALVMQLLEERHERNTEHGRKTFAILLFQDLAIVPLLLAAALLAPSGAEMGWADALAQLAWAVAAIALLIAAGRFLLDPMFRLLARTRMQEIMTASALGIVIATALLMDLVGMSYAMGSFLAGVMLAESTYRHEVEADIEPFRGLFLGLFFMAVGLSLNLETLAENWLTILVAAPAAMLLKAIAIFSVARLLGTAQQPALRIALLLPQMGEFGFVLFAAAAGSLLLAPVEASMLVAIVTVSMALSPLVARIEPLLLAKRTATPIDEDFMDIRHGVLLVGFGRFGQIVSQALFANGCDVTALDSDPDRIRDAERFGFRVHYGDGTRRDVLRAAGADKTRLIIVAVDSADAADSIVRVAKETFPQAKLFVRSHDRRHSISLARAEVDFAVRETFESALRMGKQALVALGASDEAALSVIEDVRTRDRERLRLQAEGDIMSGLDRMHVTPVQPEPLPRVATDSGEDR